MRFTFLIAMFGAALAIWEVWLWTEGLLVSAHGWVVQTGLIVYILLTPIASFFPLVALHRIMLRVKENLLEKVAAQLHLFLDTLAENKANLTECYEARLNQVKGLEELYSVIAKYPTWPFKVGEIWRFTILLLGGISPLISLVSSFFNR